MQGLRRRQHLSARAAAQPRSASKECGGSGLCEQHGRRRDRCKDCGGSGIWEHGRVRSRCKDYRCARAIADTQEKTAAALAAVAAREGEAAAPAPAAAPAAECSKCTFVSFC